MTSGYVSNVATLGIPDIRGISDGVNPKLELYFNSDGGPKGHLGVVIMDFATADRNYRVISTNFASSGDTPPGGVILYKGNNGTQDVVYEIRLEYATNSETAPYKVKSGPGNNNISCGNDEARSLIMNQIPVGWKIEVYDDPDCGTNDDWTSIPVTRGDPKRYVNSFEMNYADEYFTMEHHHKDGLDGKVSCALLFKP